MNIILMVAVRLRFDIIAGRNTPNTVTRHAARAHRLPVAGLKNGLTEPTFECPHGYADSATLRQNAV
jgi:hypothetical protein